MHGGGRQAGLRALRTVWPRCAALQGDAGCASYFQPSSPIGSARTKAGVHKGSSSGGAGGSPVLAPSGSGQAIKLGKETQAGLVDATAAGAYPGSSSGGLLASPRALVLACGVGMLALGSVWVVTRGRGGGTMGRAASGSGRFPRPRSSEV